MIKKSHSLVSFGSGETNRSNWREVKIDRLWTMAYFSRVSGDISRGELLSLAIHAQARNEALGVTGILFFWRNVFIQILEGEQVVVTDLYDEIAEDCRHTQVVTLLDRSIPKRSFEDWYMRLISPDDLRGQEHGIVLHGLESAGVWDGDQAIVRPTDGLLACPGALASGVLRVRPPEAGINHSIH